MGDSNPRIGVKIPATRVTNMYRTQLILHLPPLRKQTPVKILSFYSHSFTTWLVLFGTGSLQGLIDNSIISPLYTFASVYCAERGGAYFQMSTVLVKALMQVHYRKYCTKVGSRGKYSTRRNRVLYLDSRPCPSDTEPWKYHNNCQTNLQICRFASNMAS